MDHAPSRFRLGAFLSILFQLISVGKYRGPMRMRMNVRAARYGLFRASPIISAAPCRLFRARRIEETAFTSTFLPVLRQIPRLLLQYGHGRRAAHRMGVGEGPSVGLLLGSGVCAGVSRPAGALARAHRGAGRPGVQ